MVSYGVKQGGVVSRTLFVVYGDDLLQKRKQILALAVILASDLFGLCLMLMI